MKELLKENEVLDDLQLNNLFVIQNRRKYCFTSDSVLLANFAKVGHNDRVVEFCSGCGVISILLNEKCHPKSIVGFELQSDLCDMSNRSLKYNNIENIKFLNQPLSNACNFVGENNDVLICNPPYYEILGLKQEINPKYELAKYEKTTNLEEIFESAKRVLKFSGKFFLVHVSSRIQEILTIASKHNFVLKEGQFVFPSQKKLSNLVLLKFVKGAKKGCEIKEPKLV